MTFFLLLLSAFIIIITMLFINRSKKRTQIARIFTWNLIFILIWNVSMILQICFAKPFNIPPIYFDYIAYIGICFLPISVLFTGLSFAKTHLTFKAKHLLLLIIPIITLIVLWTNNYHHLMYEVYSISLSECKSGPYMIIHNVYSYSLLIIGILCLLKFSIKNSGFFSKQSILIFLGICIPLITNILGTFKIVPMTIYVTPITFTFTMLFSALAIFKFNFLSVAPIALQRVVDEMSDGYVVLDSNHIITDFNLTFLKMFGLTADFVRNKDFFELVKHADFIKNESSNLSDYIKKSSVSDDTFSFDKKDDRENKYFHIEISGIRSEDNYIGTLILFKDTTQHMIDLETIKDNQNMLMERERLASLGQLIGGIAHNLKTPIMSISGAAEGLSDLVKEYDSSIGDPEVTNQDHHDIAKDMLDWISKIKSYTAYMSDIITTVKGQAVNLSEEQSVAFDLEELVKRVDILMKHELKNALITLNVSIKTKSNIILHGNIVSLVQVINNMISNSIQAYNGEPNKSIDLTIAKEDNHVIISIQDYADGLPEEVQEKLFKEMITTKGKNGTGLGLFMSYSTIRAHFNGDITFESKKGQGTTFHIILPI